MSVGRDKGEHSGQVPGDALGRRAAAERDALRDVIAILAHDLSNPLQSITVLCELGLDDLAEGTPADSTHLQQCLQAAERMRSLIHGIAAVVRQGATVNPLGQVVSRVATLFARRLDRHSTQVRINLENLESMRGPAAMEFALINIVLGYISNAGDSGCKRHELCFGNGRFDGPMERCVLEVSMHCLGGEDGRKVLPCTSRHIARARDSLADTGAELAERGDTLALIFPGAT